MGDVRKEFPKARVICVGDGALSADLTQQVRELQLEENVCFVGFQSNIPDWLAMADISVLPSLFEGLPLVAIESLGAQRPMIATAVDGTSEVVLNEKTGLTVPPSDPRALGQAILRLLRDPALRQQLATEGRKWVLANFSQEQQVARTQELYLKAWNAPSALQRRARASKMAARAGEDASHAVENNFGVVEKR